MKINWKITPQEMARSNCIVRHLAGSQAYGTSTPSSDTDYRGVFISEPHYWTPFYNVETVELEDEEDTVYHEVGKFLEGVRKQNPNIIESLWVDQKDIIFSRPEYFLIRQRRSELLSAEVARTYVGYAQSQLNRIQGHNKWLMVMSQGKQQIKQIIDRGIFTTQQLRNHFEGAFLDEFGVPQSVAIDPNDVDYDWTEILRPLAEYKHARFLCNIPPMMIEYCNPSTFSKWESDGLYAKQKVGEQGFKIVQGSDGQSVFDGRGRVIPNYLVGTREKIDIGSVVDVISVDGQQLSSACESWKHYHTWRNNRNVVRSELEAKYGYDTKHASHLIRLLRSGYEILTLGEVLVKRPDAKELMAIRSGSMSLEKLLDDAASLQSSIDEAVKTTKLRQHVDIELPTTLVLQCREMMFGSVLGRKGR